MQVLFQYGERKIVRDIGEEKMPTIIEGVKVDLDIKGSVVLQRFDQEWGEWIDVGNEEEIQNRDKLTVLVQNGETAAEQNTGSPAALSPASDPFMTDINEGTVLNLF